MDPEYTVEWAKATLRAINYKPKVKLSTYVNDDEIGPVLIALKVLKLDANRRHRGRKARFMVCRSGSKVVVKTFLEPRIIIPPAQ